MIDKLKDLSLYVVIGVVLTAASHLLASEFLSRYLTAELITVLIALLAINTTTSSVVMTKLKEIADATGANFSQTIGELRRSVVEQLLFIVIAVVLQILRGSPIVLAVHPWADFVLESMLVAVFAAAIWTLFDTGRSIFVILEYENNKKHG